MNYSTFKKNIYLRVGVIILIGILIPAFVMGLVEYRTLEANLLSKTHAHMAETTKLLSQSLSRPLWDYAEPTISSIVHSSFTDDEITKIKILDSNNKVFYSADYPKAKERKLNSQMFYIEETISHDSQIIGQVQIFYTVKNVYATLHTLLLKFFFTRLIQLIVTLLTVLAFLNLGLIKRINRLSRQAKKMDMQILDEPFHWTHGDPIDELGLDLENARRSLNDLFHEVKIKNEELFKLNQELENKVKEKTQQVVHAARMAALGEMSAGVAHEINNPLTVIMATSKILENGILSKRYSQEDVVLRLQKISAMSVRIDKIVKGLRTFSGNSEKEQMKIVQLSQIFNETLVLCQEKLKNSNITLYIVSMPDIEIQCRSVEISQVFLNLINNAADAIRDLDQKWIAVEATVKNNMVEIRLTDSGKGIDPEIAIKMMQPFFTTKPVDQGTGLGLSISSGIIEEHHGRLWLDDEASNTSFVFQVPVAQEHTQKMLH